MTEGKKVLYATIEHSNVGEPFFVLNANQPKTPAPLLPHPSADHDGLYGPAQYLKERYLDLSHEFVCGSARQAAHPTRCFFPDTSLWRTPAVAPTAVVPKLPERHAGQCGFQQLELGDEEALAGYPVLQAIRAGLRLDDDSYTRGSYQSATMMPGRAGSRKPATVEATRAKAKQWLEEYRSEAPPSVPLAGLGPSVFARESPAAECKEQLAAEKRARAEAVAGPESIASSPEKQQQQQVELEARGLDLSNLFSNIYMGAPAGTAADDAAPPPPEPTGQPNPTAASSTTTEPPSRARTPASIAPVPPLGGRLRANAENALQRATSNPAGAGGVSGGPPAERTMPLTSRNLLLKERVEKKESQIKDAWLARNTDAMMEEEELLALEEETRDAVPDLPMNDDLELVLRASEMTAAAPSSATAQAPVVPRLRQPTGLGGEDGHAWAMENSVLNLHEAYAALKPGLAMQFPFELDPFQKEGVVLMESGESIFVAAHTSAGKTVLAEYAFALAELHKTKAVYTAPVKAISNQKYRDLGKKFDVGLLTGDVQINTEANCLIMTTEVLRSMLYRGANVVRDIEWVIFDEVHYMSDDSRGIVYEEVIIMLPPFVNVVMLSATVPNKMEVADWVGRTRQQVMRVCGTEQRPVPLTHFLYFSKELYPVCKKKNFDSAKYSQAKRIIEGRAESPSRGAGSGPGGAATPSSHGNSPAAKRGRGRGRSADAQRSIGRAAMGRHNDGGASRSNPYQLERQVWTETIATLRERELLPCINFMFSKKAIYATVRNLRHLDLCTNTEKNQVHAFIDRSLARLREEDRDLPQVLFLRDTLSRGIGMHHAGLLPLLKEVVEMLFCEGLVRVLYATDTFAMGVNAPARTVTFWHLNKPDGEEGLRPLRPDEYVQMAGRAGRRGIDEFGTVAVICRPGAPLASEAQLRTMMTGRSATLQSKFRLEYRMIVSLLRARDLSVEDMMRRSFSEFRAQKTSPEVLRLRDEAVHRQETLRRRPWPEGFGRPSREDTEQYFRLQKATSELFERARDSGLRSQSWLDRAHMPGALAFVQRSAGLPPQPMLLLGSEAMLRELGSGGMEARGGLKKGRKAPLPAGPARTQESAQADAVFVLALQETESESGGESDGRWAKRPSPARAEFAGMKLVKGKGSSWTPPDIPLFGDTQVLPAPAEPVQWVVQKVRVETIVAFGATNLPGIDPLLLVRDPPDPHQLVAGLAHLQQAATSVADVDYELPGGEPERVQAWRDAAQLQQEHRVHRQAHKDEAMRLIQSEQQLKCIQQQLNFKLSVNSLKLLPEYGVKLKVLQELDFVSEDELVKMKGRVACEITTCECLIATEAIFRGLFTGLSASEAAALLCALVNQHKTKGGLGSTAAVLTADRGSTRQNGGSGDAAGGAADGVPESLAVAVGDLEQLATELAVLQQERGLTEVTPEEYLAESVRPSLTEVVYLWAEGSLFRNICDFLPEGVMEGDVVRTVTRLERACEDIKSAARVMGNTVLYDQFEAAAKLIKRDIIFAGSLYIY